MKKYLLGVLVSLVSFSAMAKEPPLEQVCSDIDDAIGALLNGNYVNCLPGKSAQAGAYNFIFVAKQPMLADPQNHRALLMGIMGGAGWAMAEKPEMKGVKIAEVWIADPDLAKRKTYLRFSGADIKRWRTALYTKKSSWQDIYAQMQKAEKEVSAK